MLYLTPPAASEPGVNKINMNIDMNIDESLRVILAPILASIFNNCIKQSTFPLLWKVTRIVPVCKYGVKTNGENYSTISIFCPASELFVSILHVMLSSSVRNILRPEEHVFFYLSVQLLQILCVFCPLPRKLDRLSSITCTVTSGKHLT